MTAPTQQTVWKPRLPLRAAPWLFPAALLLFGGFFFGGHLGWWSDDYWHCLRDPVSGGVKAWVMHRGFFLRPLFYVIVPAVTTAFWDQAWIPHTLQLAVHAGVVILLWRWLLMLRLGRAASAVAALLFMMYPAQFEALFWVAALPTAISTALMLLVLILATRWRSRIVRGSFITLAAIAVLTFAAACLNEQPVSAVAALPILAWLTSSQRKGAGSGHSCSSPSVRRAALPLLPTLAAGLAAVLYIILRITDSRAPQGARGSAESFIPAARIWERTTYFCDVLWRRLVMKNWAGGALREGWDQVTAAWWGVPALLLVTGLGALWVCLPRESDDTPATHPDQNDPAPIRVGPLLALGTTIFLAGWLPILLMAAYEPDSRCRYWPNIGMALLAAAAITIVRRPWDTHRWPLWPARAALAAILLTGSLMLVGTQSGFRNRWMMDRAESAELRRLIPNPVPYTFFIPLNIEERALQTGSPVLDTHFRSVWEFPWTNPGWIRRTYQRDDVHCGYWRHWTPGIPVKGADESGIHYADTLGPRFPELPDGTRLIPWDRAVIFTIGKDHVLHVATRVVLEGVNPERVIELPQAKGLPAFEVRVKRL